jgi:hypothetical protein
MCWNWFGPNPGKFRRPTCYLSCYLPGAATNSFFFYELCHLTLGRLRVVHVQHTLDKTRNRNAGWQGKLLNSSGRCELVRSVLSAIPIYLLTSLKAPKQLLVDLDKARRRFLWASDREISGGKCKVGWPFVTRPENFGGLGILDLERFSRALRLRWLWFAWKNPDRPWSGMPVPVDWTSRFSLQQRE